MSSGERLTFRMVNGRVEDAAEGEFLARPPIIMPGEEQKKLRFLFGLTVKNGQAPRRVRVEDVTDDEPLLLVDDSAPKLEDLLWAGQSEWFGLEDREAEWISYLGESFRVYRLTITAADGRQVVLYEGSATSAFAKVVMRKFFGKDY